MHPRSPDLEATAPPGARFVASASDGVYFPVADRRWARLDARDRRWFADEEAARAAGYDPARLAIAGLEEFEIVAEIGRGATATVYRARDRLLERDVAIKVVHRSHQDDDETLARCFREARVVARLDHPGIVSLYSVRRLPSGGLALVMEYVPGRTLRDLIREEGALPIEWVDRILREVGAALAAAHRKGIVHRDVKPQNIFLQETNGRCLLADFGIAIPLGDTTRITHAGAVIGTPAYMSPEQFDGDAVDGRSDLYSLGLVGWEMLTGRSPWEGESLFNIVYKQKTVPLPPVGSVRRGVPARLRVAIERALRKDPRERWNSVEEFLACLDGDIPGFRWRVASLLPFSALAREDPPAHAARSPSVEADAPTVRLPRSALPGNGSAAHAARAAASGELPRPPGGDAAARMDRVDRARVPTPGGVPPGELVSVQVSEGRPRSRTRRWVMAGGFAVAVAGVGAAATGWPWQLPPGWDSREPVDAAEKIVAPPIAAAPAAAQPAFGFSTGSLNPAGAAQPGADSPAIGAGTSGLALGTGAGASPEALGMGFGAGQLTADPAGTASGAPISGGSRSTPREMAAQERLASGSAGEPSTAGAPTSGMVTGEPSASGSSAGGLPTGGSSAGGAAGNTPLDDGARGAAAGAPGAAATSTAANGRLAAAGLPTGATAGTTAASPPAAQPSATRSSAPPILPLDDRPSRLAAGGLHSCAILGGAVACWGGNERGQVGRGTSAREVLPFTVELAAAPYTIVAGGFHSCLLDRTGAVYCWGDNRQGQLGNGGALSSGPIRVGELRFFSLAAGLAYTCGIARNRAAYCWGSNEQGQLGLGSTDAQAGPVRVRSPEPLVSITAGWTHACGLSAQGRAYCWGDNSRGQLGDGTTVRRTAPTPVSGSLRFRSISAGSGHTCALSLDGEAYCWGQNGDGRLGDGTTGDRTVPTRVETNLRFAEVSAGGRHTCALASSGAAYCWGQNGYGQLGDGTSTTHTRPVVVATELRFQAIRSGGSHTCALTSDGNQYCWGFNIEGQLGDGSLTHSATPVAVSRGRDASG